MPSLSIGRIHLSFKGCQVSCFVFTLFRIRFPVSKQGVLIWVCSVSLCPFLWDVRCIWVSTAIHGGRYYILLHPREPSEFYFPRESANQIHLSYIYTYFCNVRRNKVSEFAYQIGHFSGKQRIPDNVSLLVVLRTTVYQKCKQNLGKRYECI